MRGTTKLEVSKANSGAIGCLCCTGRHLHAEYRPRGDGSVSTRCAAALRDAESGLLAIPKSSTTSRVLLGSIPCHGDVTQKDNSLFLTVFEWPASGELYLPNIEQDVQEARLLWSGDSV